MTCSYTLASDIYSNQIPHLPHNHFNSTVGKFLRASPPCSSHLQITYPSGHGSFVNHARLTAV